MISRPEFRSYLPVAVVGGFCAAFGLTKAIFALYLLAATTVLGVAVGPYPLILISTADAVVGVIVIITAVSLILKHQLALLAIRRGIVPLISYEVGRELGLQSAALPTEVSILDMVMKIAVLCCLIGVALYSQSPALDRHIKQQA